LLQKRKQAKPLLAAHMTHPSTPLDILFFVGVRRRPFELQEKKNDAISRSVSSIMDALLSGTKLRVRQLRAMVYKNWLFSVSSWRV